MRVRAVLALALIVGLLLAVALPTYAGKGGEKKDKPHASGQDKPKKEKGGQKPVETPDPSDSADGMVTLCHKPGTPAEQTLVVAEPALGGHLGHGDYEGECLELTVTPTPTDTVPITNTATITICHKPGTPAEKTLELPAPAIPGHLRHGDYVGECTEVTPTPTITPTETITPTPPITPTEPVTPTETPTATMSLTATEMVSICHKLGTPAEQTLQVPESAVPAHMAHGDEMGACPDQAPPPPSTDTSEANYAAYPDSGRNKR